jgi:Na+-driven multidrug efflux pump
MGYSLVLVAPLMVLVGPWLAGALAESPQTAQYTTFALYLVPLACIASTPFFLVRPVFEALGQGRPGLIMAVIRAVVLTVPLAWGGQLLAERMGYPGLYGMLFGLLAVGALSSSAFVVWLRKTLQVAISEHDSLVASGPLIPVPPALATEAGTSKPVD